MTEYVNGEPVTDDPSWNNYDLITGFLLLLDICFLAPVAIGAIFGFVFTALIWSAGMMGFLLLACMNPCM